MRLVGDGTGKGSISGTPIVRSTQLGITGVTTTGLPAIIIGGTKNAKGTALVTVKNNGSTKLKGKAVLSIYASADDVLSASADTFLGKLNASLNLAAGASATFKVAIVIPKVAADASLDALRLGHGRRGYHRVDGQPRGRGTRSRRGSRRSGSPERPGCCRAWRSR